MLRSPPNNLAAGKPPSRMRSPAPVLKKISSVNPYYEKSTDSHFTVELLFLERNLMNLTIEEELKLDDKFISQTTEQEQQQYCNTFLDDFDEEDFSEAINQMPNPGFKQRERIDSENWNFFYGNTNVSPQKIGKQWSTTSVSNHHKRFEADIQSLKIFVQTIKQYCIKFSDYQSKN